MPQHISRKELKRDSVRDTLVHGAEAVASHQQLVMYAIGIAVVVALAVFGWRFYSARQTVKASAEFAEAMKIYQARLRTPGETVELGEVTYTDQTNKYRDAAKKFEDVINHYPRTRPGELARYYAALSLENLGQYGPALDWLRGLERMGGPDFSALARFAEAQIDDKAGKGADALKIYQDLMAKPAVLVPKATVMLALADHYRPSNPAEAARLYNQIKTQYPDTAISQQADQQLQLLPGKT